MSAVHCIPIDPFYLTWKAREYGVATRFIELAGEINSGMPAYVVQKLVDALNERGNPVKKSRILVLGGAYKRDTKNDPRESPGLEIIEDLIAKRARVDYSDPHLPNLPIGRRHQFDLTSVTLTETRLREYDAVLVVTDHSRFPYEVIFRAAPLIVDTRNALHSRGFRGPHVVSA